MVSCERPGFENIYYLLDLDIIIYYYYCCIIAVLLLTNVVSYWKN